LTLDLSKTCVSMMAEDFGITRKVVLTKRLVLHEEELEKDEVGQRDWFEYDLVADPDDKGRVHELEQAERNVTIDWVEVRAKALVKEGMPRAALDVLGEL
jgi:hypothetical protein